MSTGGADKCLAQPGMKQATATKLGIYSTYSPRSLVHFLARCSNFCKSLKKNSESCPSNQVSAAATTSTSDKKWRPFSCFFSRVGLRTYQHPCVGSTNGMFIMIWGKVYFVTKFGSKRSVWRWGLPSFIKNMDCLWFIVIQCSVFYFSFKMSNIML